MQDKSPKEDQPRPTESQQEKQNPFKEATAPQHDRSPQEETDLEQQRKEALTERD